MPIWQLIRLTDNDYESYNSARIGKHFDIFSCMAKKIYKT